MQLVGAGLDCQSYDGVAGLAVFRRKITLKNFKFVHGVGGDTLVPLGVGGDERNGTSTHKDVGSAFLPTVHLEIVARIASRIVRHATDESGDEFDKLDRIANGPGNLQRQISYKRWRY